MSQLPRLLASCVSVAYLVAATVPCGFSESLVASANALAAATGAQTAKLAAPSADAHAHHRALDEGPPAAQAEHSEHAAHGPHAQAAPPPVHHAHDAAPGTRAEIGAPCACGCSDSSSAASGYSSARVGFALARADWPRALAPSPLRHATLVAQPPGAPALGGDPIPI